MVASSLNDRSNTPSPAWASWLGIVAIVLGVLLTAGHGTEWMKQLVIAEATPASGQVPAAECPQDELEEEALSRGECEQMVANVQGFVLSAPAWFSAFQATRTGIGTLIALGSIVVGAGLIDYRRWAPAAAALTFAALAIIDVIGFVGVIYTGPILRDIYLWNILLWLVIHMMMTVGVVAGRHSQGDA